MMDNKHFWLAQNIFLLAVYACGIAHIAMGDADAIMVWVGAILLVIHVLEIPLAYLVLREQNPAPLKLAVHTLLFGFTWWLPARRGVYEVF